MAIALYGSKYGVAAVRYFIKNRDLFGAAPMVTFIHVKDQDHFEDGQSRERISGELMSVCSCRLSGADLASRYDCNRSREETAPIPTEEKPLN